MRDRYAQTPFTLLVPVMNEFLHVAKWRDEYHCGIEQAMTLGEVERAVFDFPEGRYRLRTARSTVNVTVFPAMHESEEAEAVPDSAETAKLAQVQRFQELLSRGPSAVASAEVLSELREYFAAEAAQLRKPPRKNIERFAASQHAYTPRTDECAPISLLDVHGEDIYATFENGVSGPAQRQLLPDVVGWGLDLPALNAVRPLITII